MRAILGGTIATFSLILSAPAQTAPAEKPAATTDTQTFGDWGVRCFAGRLPPCEMFQTARSKTGAVEAEFIVVYLPRRDSHMLQLTLPLGVSFAKGVKLLASGYTSQAMPYLRCDNAGCHVQGAVARGALDALDQSDPRAKLVVGSLRGRDVEIPLSLRGFAAARAAMEKLAREKTGTETKK
jgi:invasion protein IalB